MKKTKIDLTTFHDAALLQLLKMTDKLRTIMIETDEWEDFLPHIDKNFTYTEIQLEKVKKDFLNRRN